ncbi:helix-turn-helix transcriptional regulator [Tenacibaculum agarivorans]|uniref:helix-turn-helix transcriptional regulator n=1 Tax=Tenacibaculum agarivorans TaxID=1908389 RepID=UPI00094B9EBC|nr:helix-turn-helix transcriptional regulator [Tenacibaculum agarivorans]
MIDRLKIILDHYNLTSSNFAEKIDVPRSSISHLLSGRNKPSLDFIIKVDKTFEEVDLDWLLYGEGSFPKNSDTKDSPPSLFSQRIVKSSSKEESILTKDVEKPEKKNDNSLIENKKLLVKVILLYNDGTFDEFDR